MKRTHIDNETFFSVLRNEPGLIIHKQEPQSAFPWKGSGAEDQTAAEDAIVGLYAGLGLKAPRMVWAASPKAMWAAVEMLREIHHNQRHTMVNALAKMENPIETEAKRVLLESIIDREITVTTGGSLKAMLQWKTERLLYPAIADLATILNRALPPRNSSGKAAPAGWNDVVLYPALIKGLTGYLPANALCMLPYTHICWLCKPPIEVYTSASGHLHRTDGAAMRFADGFEVYATYEEPDALPEPNVAGLSLPEPGRP